MGTGNEILERSYSFAVRIVRLSRALANDRVGHVLFRQLLRSGTSIGANVEEAQAAQSRRDFVSKLSIARKEARETLYWLRLLCDAEVLPSDQLADLRRESELLVRLLTAIIKTTRDTEGEGQKGAPG